MAPMTNHWSDECWSTNPWRTTNESPYSFLTQHFSLCSFHSLLRAKVSLSNETSLIICQARNGAITICVQPVSVPNFSRLFTFQTSCFLSETCTFEPLNCYVVYKKPTLESICKLGNKLANKLELCKRTYEFGDEALNIFLKSYLKSTISSC